MADTANHRNLTDAGLMRKIHLSLLKDEVPPPPNPPQDSITPQNLEEKNGMIKGLGHNTRHPMS